MNPIALSMVAKRAPRILLASLLGLSQSAWAGQTQDRQDKPNVSGSDKVQQSRTNPSPLPLAKPAVAEEESASSHSSVAKAMSQPRGQHEGIKVHGHWTIEVRNPDGEVVTHREFENSLTQATGAPLLASLLNSQGQALPSPFYWAIELDPDPAAGSGLGGIFACNSANPNDSGGGASCLLIQQPLVQTFLLDNFLFAGNLTSSVNSGTLVLSGSVVASASFTVSSVATTTVTVTNPTSSAPGLTASQFTSASSPAFTSVSAAAGQTIQVTVNISFS